VSKSLSSIRIKLRNRVTDHTGFRTKLSHFAIETVDSLSILISSCFPANNSIIQVSKDLKGSIDALINSGEINHSLVVRSKGILALAIK
jgi:hypothetical protein